MWEGGAGRRGQATDLKSVHWSVIGSWAIFIFSLSVFFRFFHNTHVLVFATQKGVLFALHRRLFATTRRSRKGTVSVALTDPVQFGWHLNLPMSFRPSWADPPRSIIILGDLSPSGLSKQRDFVGSFFP